jgi:hypothetical protein
MKKWLIFGSGVLTGIVLTFVFAFIFSASRSEGDDDVTWFENPGDVIDVDAFEVFQVIGNDAALVHGKSREYSSMEVFSGGVYLLTNEDGKYYYDDEVVRVSDGKVAKQVGIYHYQTKSDFGKTVPIIQIMNK